MEDILKKFLYTSVGFVSLATEKFQKTIEILVSEKKISSEEGKRLLEDFFKQTETKKEEFESQMNSVVEKVVKSFSFATTNDIEELSKRVRALEELTAAEVTTTIHTQSTKKTTTDESKEA